MNSARNPYANALDGLHLPDPVAAFFDFCRERERIRRLRESGAPAPWSTDPIFVQGRFLNVFREDDRVSQALFRFVTPVTDNLSALIQALFFARWCNRQATLDAISAGLLADPPGLRRALQNLSEPPWCNMTAYPVEPVQWEGKTVDRFDTATSLFGEITPFLIEAIRGADGDVIGAVEAINTRLRMANHFPIFMAVVDLAWFRPDIIDPASSVPTGIGAVAYLDRLQAHLGLHSHNATCQAMIELQATHWPEARRPFQPIDIEYLACECRKYYSYVNGTKSFEGKNLFRAGQSPQVTFEIPAEAVPDAEIQTRIQVIAGGPCSGKTTLLQALAEAGCRVERESAEQALQAGVAAGRTAEELRADPVAWQLEMLARDFALFDGLPTDEVVFTDTSFVETLVFGARAGIVMGPNVQAWLTRKRYERVFFLQPLDDYAQSAVRMESHEAALQISEQVRAAYERCGYRLVEVPAGPIENRVCKVT